MSGMTDKELQAHITNAKTDLNAGVAASVPTGQENAPPSKSDPVALRKAMFKKADALRAKESGVEVDPVAQTQIDDMRARQMPGEGQPQTARQRQQQEQRTDLVQEPTQPAKGADPGELIQLKVGDATIKVTRADIERAGGEELYLRRRAMDEEQLQLSKERQQVAEARKELADRLAASQQRSNRSGVDPAPGQGTDPANLGADPASTVNPGARGADIAAMSREIASQLYSGDEESAVKSVERILRIAAARGEQPSVEEIAAQVAEKLKDGAAEKKPEPVASNPVVETVNAQINKMARDEFPELIKDEVARTAAFAQFQKMVRLPENADRRAVDVARDACQWAEDNLRNPRGKVIEQKRSLQPTNAAANIGGMVDAEPDQQTASDAISQIASFRRFGRQPRNA